jgi:hypothetical protein
MDGITAITQADILNAPVRTVRSADPFHTPESAELKRGFVYGLLEPGTRRLRYIGSTTRTLSLAGLAHSSFATDRQRSDQVQPTNEVKS